MKFLFQHMDFKWRIPAPGARPFLHVRLECHANNEVEARVLLGIVVEEPSAWRLIQVGDVSVSPECPDPDTTGL